MKMVVVDALDRNESGIHYRVVIKEKEEELSKHGQSVAQLRQELETTQKALLAATTKLAATVVSASSSHPPEEEEEEDGAEKDQPGVAAGDSTGEDQTPTPCNSSENQRDGSEMHKQEESHAEDEDEFEDCIM